MPQRCTVCAHLQLAETDRELATAAASEPKRRIAAHFGLSAAAVVQHAKRHIMRYAVAPCRAPEREVLA